MPLPLESVPNISEGRSPETLAALRGVFSRPARLLDVHTDWDHHRSVFTLVGSEEELVETLLAGIAAAAERIDLTRHQGAHPRIGAADVVPLVPLEPDAEPAARAAALELAERVGAELGLPVFLYGRLTEDAREPAFFRRGGPDGLQRRIDAGELGRTVARRGCTRRPAACWWASGGRSWHSTSTSAPATSARRERSPGSCASGTAGSPASAPSASTSRARVSSR